MSLRAQTGDVTRMSSLQSTARMSERAEDSFGVGMRQVKTRWGLGIMLGNESRCPWALCSVQPIAPICTNLHSSYG